MTTQFGYDFDELNGNVDILLIKGDKTELCSSTYLKSLQGEWEFKESAGENWNFYEGTACPAEGFEILAQELSKEYSTKAIYFYWGDASGWMGYKLFENGEEKEDYSFGLNYDEEMEEMGVDFAESRKEGTLVANDDEENQYLFWSVHRQKNEEEIQEGEAFIDAFLREEKAYIGWNLFPNA